jgi:predicted nucleic acid-binding Zn ribbon protein
MTFEDNTPDDWVIEDDEEDADDCLMCPSCGASVHEDTQQCPSCGDWIVPAYPKSRWKHWVWVIVVLLLALSFVLSVTF